MKTCWVGDCMSVNKKGSKKNTTVSITGKVVLKKFGEGSKSEHEALHLESAKGSYLLRKQGGNPFNDTSLNKLEGKEVTATGFIDRYIFFASDIEEKNKKA